MPNPTLVNLIRATHDAQTALMQAYAAEMEAFRTDTLEPFIARHEGLSMRVDSDGDILFSYNDIRLGYHFNRELNVADAIEAGADPEIMVEINTEFAGTISPVLNYHPRFTHDLHAGRTLTRSMSQPNA